MRIAVTRLAERAWTPWIGRSALTGVLLCQAWAVCRAVDSGAKPGVNPVELSVGELLRKPSAFRDWDMILSARTEGGYADNVLQSDTFRHGSGFLAVGADLFVVHLPAKGPEFNLFFSGDDRRYFSSVSAGSNQPSATKDQYFITQATMKQVWRDAWTFSFAAQHVYNDQVYDASDLEDGFGSIRTQGNYFNMLPSVRRGFGKSVLLEAAVRGGRQFFRSPISSYWEAGPRLTAGWTPSTNTTLELGLSENRRWYDGRLKTDLAGNRLPGTHLETDDQRVELVWRQTWDSHRWWSTTLRGYFNHRTDDAAGYYDYDRLGAAVSLKFSPPHWVARLSARGSTYDFRRQLVSPFNPVPRTREEAELEARIERQITKQLRAYVRGLHDFARSNVPLDRYRANTALAGIEWDF
ncbi:MAG: hypothetical protein EXS36_14530 [Pedosphaera sp.]|nr:hypothetical protein [Pedosphaera sp.]